MLVGHFAVGLAAKRLAPDVNVAWFVAAVSLPDVVTPALMLMGIERMSFVAGATAYSPLVLEYYPWSHSLVMGFVWGAVLAGIAGWRGVPKTARWILVAAVVSHWLLDFVTHAPDMPLWPGSPRVGLGLWNSVAATFAVEGALWVAGIAIYLRARPRVTRGAAIAFWLFVAVVTAMWVTPPFQPLPTNPQAVSLFGLVVASLFIPWTFYADRPTAAEA